MPGTRVEARESSFSSKLLTDSRERVQLGGLSTFRIRSEIDANTLNLRRRIMMPGEGGGKQKNVFRYFSPQRARARALRGAARLKRRGVFPVRVRNLMLFRANDGPKRRIS